MDNFPNAAPILDLVCPPRTDMLRLIRSVVATVSRELGFAPDETSMIEISVDEACTNVIRHAYGDEKPEDPQRIVIRVQIRPGPDHLVIRVIDHGSGTPGGEPKGISSIEEYSSQTRPKGLGSYIISQFMDEVAYDSPPGAGTVLSMVKYLHRSRGL